MKITKTQLKQLIKEEIEKTFKEEKEVLDEAMGLGAIAFFTLIHLYVIFGFSGAAEDFWNWVKKKHGDLVAKRGQELLKPEVVEARLDQAREEIGT